MLNYKLYYIIIEDQNIVLQLIITVSNTSLFSKKISLCVYTSTYNLIMQTTTSNSDYQSQPV